ncbi:MAG: LTA synthase family protein [Firmicutes bacterium]|nr:LTA synthase family protein [Bacillota bacterium]
MIKFSKPAKLITGLVIMTALMVFTAVNTGLFAESGGFKGFEYALMYILAAASGAFLIFDIKELYKPVYYGICAAAFFAVPFIMLQLSMTISGTAEFSLSIYFINALIYFVPAVIMYIFTNSFRVSASFAIFMGVLFNITCYVVNCLRGNPFIPVDLLAIGTAATVASTYTFKLEWELIYAIVLTVFSAVTVWAFPLKIEFKFSRYILRGGAAVIMAVIAAAAFNVDFKGMDMDVFDQYHANNTHGAAYSFFINCCKMRLEKPDGYSEDDVELMLASLEEEEDEAEEETLPNIVVIMNESYSDLNVIGDVQTNVPYNEYFYSLRDNTVRGELLVSPFGGYTCNSEFEFLTGLTMGLLPTSSAPYLQYVNKKGTYYLPNYLKTLGYTTIALHPYYAKSWNRETVYSLMGFDNFISMDNMSEYQDESLFEHVRMYLSDNTSFSAVINQFETKDDDERLFLFNITMQNHGSYTYDNESFENDVHITNLSGDYPQAEQYLSLLKRTDLALEVLINYFKNYDEPTVIVMFGDHQPSVEQAFYEELYGKTLDQLEGEEFLNRYKVPFFIWTNYEQESRDGILTSTNYLSSYVLEAAGLPKNKINLFLDTIQDDIPRINAFGHYDVNGNWSENNTEESDALKKYNYLEYYMLTHKPADTETP